MLKLNNVTKSFHDHLLFSHLTYTFADRGLYLVPGESGSGKTTLLRMIAGLDRDYSGTIEGGPCSYLFQDKRLFPSFSALGNVAAVLPEDDAESRAEEILLSLRLAKKDLCKRPAALSGGMQQRVAIARALAYDAPVLLLDEPTKELDPENRALVRDLIRKEAERRTVILVTHDDDPNLYPGAETLILKRE